MDRLPRPRLKFGWAAPAGAVIVAGAVLGGTILASAASPQLPRRTPAQLLASIAHAKVPRAMTATLTESANLGFPALPDIAGSSSSALSPASLISGTHAIEVWYAGPRHVRIALPVPFGETDLRVNGSQVWLWDSSGQIATHILPPAANRYMLPGPAAYAGQGGNRCRGQETLRGDIQLSPSPPTPLQAAKRLLALIGPTTRVTVSGTTVVAGRDAYELAIAPRSRQSLVGRILIAIDAKTHLPLRVQVFARGRSSPALAIGFTSLSFARPAASNFRFTPPPGAHVKTMRLMGGGPGVMPGGLHNGWSGVPPGAGGQGPLANARTFGTGWLTAADIPVRQVTASVGNHSRYGLGPLALLLKAAKPVHGSWGSGRLLRTSLLSVLLTSKGQLLVGAVTPTVLYADAAKVK
jgi:outer membrane lipoprotein-sorting protein